LTDLVSSTSFDGENFMIVKGKGKCVKVEKKEVCTDEAIGFDADKDLLLKASTTYFHLTKARTYFIEKMDSDYVKKLPKMVIRLEHSNQFSELGHFANDNLDPQFNNALTVPGGKGLASKGVKPWGMEIWFRAPKEIHLRDIDVNNLQTQEFKVLMSGFRNQIHMQSLSRFLATSITALTLKGSTVNPLGMDNLIRTAGSSIVMEMGYLFIEPLSRALSRKWYHLDTALVPEIIYHEYSHAALSDHLVLSHSTAIIEGMADFFAGQIAKSPKLAKHIKKYNTFNGKNAKRKQQYKIEFEMNDYANTDFVFGLLWELKKIVGEDKGEAFIYSLRENLTTNSGIRTGLVDGILDTCEQKCSEPFNDKIQILKSLNLRGI
jgi:hypothetical protein